MNAAARTRSDRRVETAEIIDLAHDGRGVARVAGKTVFIDDALPGEQVELARDWLAVLRAGLPENVTMSAGISAVAEPADLPAGRQEADECLALHESAGGAPPVYDESWGDILLQRLRAAARTGRTPARGPVGELRRHDARHGTRYVATLRAWLEAQGDPVAAAERLGVHPNTVRNRLRKIGEITPLDLDDARQRLAMIIQLAALGE